MAKKKSRGRIDVINAGGEVVAQFAWLGTMQRGLGRWINVVDDSVQQKIAMALTTFLDLNQNEFIDLSATSGYTKGWQGFEGYLQGLRLALDPFGLAVRYETVLYPVS